MAPPESEPKLPGHPASPLPRKSLCAGEVVLIHDEAAGMLCPATELRNKVERERLR
jgi:hypothetical protein